MTEQEVNNLIDSKIGKVKMSQLPEATQTSGLYSIGYTGNQSVKYKANLLQGDPLTVRKTYQTEAEALADKNPIDPITSLPLTVGQFVSIVDDGEKNGIYRIGSIGVDGTMSLELQGKLGDMSEYAKKDRLINVSKYPYKNDTVFAQNIIDLGVDKFLIDAYFDKEYDGIIDYVIGYIYPVTKLILLYDKVTNTNIQNMQFVAVEGSKFHKWISNNGKSWAVADFSALTQQTGELGLRTTAPSLSPKLFKKPETYKNDAYSRYPFQEGESFSQLAISTGYDKFLIDAYFDFNYEEGKEYVLSYIYTETKHFLLSEIDLTSGSSIYKINSYFKPIVGSKFWQWVSDDKKSWMIVDFSVTNSTISNKDFTAQSGTKLSRRLFKKPAIKNEAAENLVIANLHTDILEGKLLEDVINYDTSTISTQFQSSNKVGGEVFGSSTFSGNGMYLGTVPAFRYVTTYFKCADWLANTPITQMQLLIKQDNHLGEVIYEKIIDKTIPVGGVSLVLFDLGELKTFSGNIFISIRANKYGSAMKALDSTYAYIGENYPRPSYKEHGSFTHAESWSNGSASFYLQLFSEIDISQQIAEDKVRNIESRLEISIEPETIDISLPDKIYAVVGDTLQMFFRGMVKSSRPYQYDILVRCAKGKQTPRYFEYTPTIGDVGTTEFKIQLRKEDGSIVGEKTCQLVTKNAVKSPTTKKNVAVFGDSLTAGGAWVKEFDRRLTGSGGTPIGKGFTNIEFIGQHKNGTTGYFGLGGWHWQSYIDASRPAFRFIVSGIDSITMGASYTNNGNTYTIIEINVTGGTGNILCSVTSATHTPTASGTLTKASGSGDATITFSSFTADSQNPLWDMANNKMSFIPYADEYADGQIDVVYTLLSWNSFGSWMSDFTTILSRVKIFADTLHAEFPNAKLKIMGIQVGSYNGGTGANYGANSSLSDDLGVITSVLNQNKAYQEFANKAEYKSFVEFVNVSAQLDTEYGHPYIMKPVNVRDSTNTEMIGTNGVHPNSSGSMQISDVAYRNFVANFCQ